MSVEDRFWKYVLIDDGCWTWTGFILPLGYGQMRGFSGKLERAHRISWVLANGEIPDGLCVCHKCDNRICVRPGHLFLGTKKDNTQDMVAKGRAKGGRGMCKLTADQVRQIRDRYAVGGVNQGALAIEFGVSGSTISQIVTRKLWAQVV